MGLLPIAPIFRAIIVSTVLFGPNAFFDFAIGFHSNYCCGIFFSHSIPVFNHLKVSINSCNLELHEIGFYWKKPWFELFALFDWHKVAQPNFRKYLFTAASATS